MASSIRAEIVLARYKAGQLFASSSERLAVSSLPTESFRLAQTSISLHIGQRSSNGPRRKAR